MQAKFTSPHVTVGRIRLSLDTLTQPEAIYIVHVFLIIIGPKAITEEKQGSNGTEEHG